MVRASEIEETPIVREGASSVVMARLLGHVKAERLRPGDRLPSERHLAEMFAVSRPTVREALRALLALGVLEIRHGGGVFVTDLTADDLLGPLKFFLTLRELDVGRLYEARKLIEGEIAALAARAATADDVAGLSEMIDGQEAILSDPAAYRDADITFHARLAAIAGNPFLARAAESLIVLGQEFLTLASETPEVLAGSVADHRRIVAGMSDGDGAAARAAMVAHMDRVLRKTCAVLGRDDV